MQKTFKVLATIAAWVLFILALVGFVWTFVSPAGSGLEIAAFFAVWVAALALSVVVMKIRQTLQ